MIWEATRKRIYHTGAIIPRLFPGGRGVCNTIMLLSSAQIRQGAGFSKRRLTLGSLTTCILVLLLLRSTGLWRTIMRLPYWPMIKNSSRRFLWTRPAQPPQPYWTFLQRISNLESMMSATASWRTVAPMDRIPFGRTRWVLEVSPREKTGIWIILPVHPEPEHTWPRLPRTWQPNLV